MKVKRPVSAGGIVVKPSSGEWKVALIARKGKAVWCLPKGHLESKETLEEAALREVLEETGLTARILEKLGGVSYWFTDRSVKGRLFKTVHFYLMQFVGGSMRDHDFEVDEVRWFSIPEALRRMTYPGERKLVKQAESILAERILAERKHESR